MVTMCEVPFAVALHVLCLRMKDTACSTEHSRIIDRHDRTYPNVGVEEGLKCFNVKLNFVLIR
jgi:hypothetical protein